MPCMCGDICCPNCGPAQGNSRCPLCGEWMSEGCKHFSIKTGRMKLRYQKEAAMLAKAAAEADEEYAKELQAEDAAWDKYVDQKIDELRETGKRPTMMRRTN